jgi:hypothetical protein
MTVRQRPLNPESVARTDQDLPGGGAAQHLDRLLWKVREVAEVLVLAFPSSRYDHRRIHDVYSRSLYRDLIVAT